MVDVKSIFPPGSMSQTISPGPGSEHISGAAQAALGKRL